MTTHETLQKFGYPTRTIREYAHWVVLLRPQQVTLGSCVICVKDDVKTVGAIGPDAFAEYSHITTALEAALKAAFNYDKINYLSLMMVDPQVHYHVLPRYETPRTFDWVAYVDSNWPKPPSLGAPLDFSNAQLDKLQQTIIENWPA